MDDGNNRRPSPATTSCASAGNCRRPRRRVDIEDSGDAAETSCTGKSCQSCTAGAIADCVAVCCCPCAVVNFLALALVRLPWAVARRCLSGVRRRRCRRRLEADAVVVIPEGAKAEEAASTTDAALSGTSDVATGGDALNDHLSAEFKAGDVWLEMYEVGHLGFGRVSFSGIPYQDNKGN